MTERDRVTCPFCDAEIGMVAYADNGIHPQSDCPLSTFSFRREQWDMRPPKKECPPMAATLEPEVVWLRRMLEVATKWRTE